MGLPNRDDRDDRDDALLALVRFVRGKNSCGFSSACRLSSADPDKVIRHFSGTVMAVVFNRFAKAVILSVSESVMKTTQGRIAVGLVLFW